MRNTREKGITLIALIITIIVMLILVAVTVNVALNGGLFTTAKDAAIKTEMETIKERAENVKATLYADSIKDENINFDIKTYKEKLKEEFKGSELGYTKVIVENRKYDIIILDSDLNIEVRVHSEEDSLLTNTDITSGGIVYSKYIEWNDDILAGAEVGTKQEIVDGYITFYINYSNVKMNNGTVVHDNLEEWIQDEEAFKSVMKEVFGIDASGITSKLDLYKVFSDPGSYSSEEEYIEAFFNDFWGGATEETICSNSWIMYIYKDGTIKDIKTNIIYDNKDYNFKKNGNYEIVIKSITGQELAREEIKCEDITEDLAEKYDFILEDGSFNVEGGNEYWRNR